MEAHYLQLHDNDPVAAATAVARGLMRGDRETFKAGYTVENALLAVTDVFHLDPQAVEAVREALA